MSFLNETPVPTSQHDFIMAPSSSSDKILTNPSSVAVKKMTKIGVIDILISRHGKISKIELDYGKTSFA